MAVSFSVQAPSRNQVPSPTGAGALGEGQAVARLGASEEASSADEPVLQGQAAQDAALLQMRSMLTGLMNNGNASVDMANDFLGDRTIDVKGKLDNYSAAGGTGNNDADFVSAILANTQGFKKQKGDAAVSIFKENLIKQGWKKVDKAQAKPGDVVFFNGVQHVKLVSKEGGVQGVGASGTPKEQSIQQDNLQWGTPEFYQKG
jgi:hypothetical protein